MVHTPITCNQLTCLAIPCVSDGAQTATLYKDGAGPSWRPKLLTLKVQAVAAAEHGGVPTGVPGAAAAALPPPRTVAKAELDVAAYCGPQALGPRQLRIQLQ